MRYFIKRPVGDVFLCRRARGNDDGTESPMLGQPYSAPYRSPRGCRGLRVPVISLRRRENSGRTEIEPHGVTEDLDRQPVMPVVMRDEQKGYAVTLPDHAAAP